MEENSHEQTGLLPVQAMRTLTATLAMRAVAARAAEDELIASIEREERVKAQAERKAAQATRAKAEVARYTPKQLRRIKALKAAQRRRKELKANRKEQSVRRANARMLAKKAARKPTKSRPGKGIWGMASSGTRARAVSFKASGGSPGSGKRR
jgi:hypothetical protein